MNIFHTLKNFKIIFLLVFCVDDTFSRDIVLYKGNNTVRRFIEMILREHGCCRKVMKKHFNKSVVMSIEENEKF